jgi:hypothetical protein
MCDRVDKRPIERMSRLLLTPLATVAPTFMTIPTSVVGKALVNNSILGHQTHTHETLENGQIHAMGKKVL